MRGQLKTSLFSEGWNNRGWCQKHKMVKHSKEVNLVRLRHFLGLIEQTEIGVLEIRSIFWEKEAGPEELRRWSEQAFTTIDNIPLRNKMEDILLARKWDVIPSLFKRKKGVKKKASKQDCMKKGCCLQHLFIFWMWMTAQVWLSAQVKREVTRYIFWARFSANISEHNSVLLTLCKDKMYRSKWERWTSSLLLCLGQIRCHLTQDGFQFWHILLPKNDARMKIELLGRTNVHPSSDQTAENRIIIDV